MNSSLGLCLCISQSSSVSRRILYTRHGKAAIPGTDRRRLRTTSDADKTAALHSIYNTFSCGRYSRYSIICTVSFRNLCFFRVNSLCRRNLYLESVVVLTTYRPGALGCTRERGLLCRLNPEFSNASNVRSNPYTQAGRHHA